MHKATLRKFEEGSIDFRIERQKRHKELKIKEMQANFMQKMLMQKLIKRYLVKSFTAPLARAR